MATKTNGRKMGDLYAGLSDLERARLLARFWREKNPAELDRLRNSVPNERAGKAYNEALAALRGLNSAFVLYQLMYLRTGFDRDLFAWHTLQTPGHEEDAARDVLMGLSDVISYPVTQSEYAALVKRSRAELRPIGDWADLLFGESGLRPELQEIVREYEEADEPGEAERGAFWESYYDRIRAVVRAAIKRGELPKPRKAPKDALGGGDDIWLPDGALSDWAKGTAEATYKLSAIDAVPALEFFQGFLGYDIRPDSEAEQVRARRAKLRKVYLRIGRYSLHIPEDMLEPLSFEPVQSEREWIKGSDYVATLWKAADRRLERDGALRSLMQQFAERKATLRAMTDTIETLQREMFGGEDPLDRHAREILESAWESANEAEKSLSLHRELPLAHGVTEPWPDLDSEAVYAHFRPEYERHIRGGGE